jgi:hypothetical protein
VKQRIQQLYPESVPICSYVLVQQILISGSPVTTEGYANKRRWPPDTKRNCKYAQSAVSDGQQWTVFTLEGSAFG